MAKKDLAVNFDEDAFISGAGTGEVEKKASVSKQKLERQRIIDRILREGEISDIKPKNQPKNGRSESVYYKNNLSTSERKPFYVGTAINVPLFVEEFLAIQKAFDDFNDTEATTLTDYIREVLKAKAKAVLPSDVYDEIANEKLNMVSIKKDDK